VGRIFRRCERQQPTTSDFRGQFGIYDRRRLGAPLPQQRYSAWPVIVEICNTP